MFGFRTFGYIGSDFGRLVERPKSKQKSERTEQNLFQTEQNRFGTSFVLENMTYLSRKYDVFE